MSLPAQFLPIEQTLMEEKMTSPDIRIVCRGEEGGVKGHDRVAAAQPPLTPPAPRLCSVYPGNVRWDLSSPYCKFVSMI